jgi:uncharacterized membrane protein
MADLGKTTQSVVKTVSKANPAKGDGPLSDPKNLAAAGAALIALPIVVERVAQVVGPKASEKASDLADRAKRTAKEQVKDKAGEVMPDMPKPFAGAGGLLSGKLGGGDEKGDGGGRAAPGHGSGRRMPIQQSVDVAVPLKEAYNQWTQFEDWPDFMHRLESVEQSDDATVTFQAKAWGIKKRFEAEIREQKPDERIEWNASEGFAHTGVVTFHRLGPRLTRIEVTMDVEPHGLVEKASRGMRFVKRAVRGDLHRFKAYVELKDEAEGGWRGTIEDGEVKRRTERRSTGGRSQSSRNGSRSKGRARSSGRSKAASRS